MILTSKSDHIVSEIGIKNNRKKAVNMSVLTAFFDLNSQSFLT